MYGNSIDDARTFGVPNNVATALLVLVAVTVGLLLVLGPGDRRGVSSTSHHRQDGR